MFFKNLLKRIKKRKPMMANRMGGFLRNRPQLMERIRNAKGMRGMGRSMMNPNMQFGIMGLNPMMARSMKAKMMGLPDPKDFDANNLPFPLPGQRSDIMPRDPGFGVNMPKRPPVMPGAMPPIGMAEGGEFPNAGLAALAKERPDVVKKILGKANGGEMSFSKVYERLYKELGPISNKEYQNLRQMVYSTGLSYEGMKRVIQDARAAASGSAASLGSSMDRKLPGKFDNLSEKVMGKGRPGGLTSASRAMGRSLPNQSKALANAIMKVSPTIRMPVAAGRGMLGRLAGPVTAGLGALSFMDYYNKLRNPEPETITLTQEEFDEMRRRAND